MVKNYIQQWTQNITDVTEYVHETKKLLDLGKLELIKLPKETAFPVSEMEKKLLGMTD